MKNKLTNAIALMLLLAMYFSTGNTIAQSKSASMKDCCMMKDGKMMVMKNGKTMPMDKDMTMKNGTVCMVNGECVMKDGKKMMMKEGECMDMMGSMKNCSVTTTHTKRTTKKVTHKHSHSTTYTCPMHPDIVKDKAGTCPTCGMDLIVKK